MRLPSGTHLGHYEVVSYIGAGGMGEVYRARDTQLGRDVAIKMLPESFAKDPERIARLHREAKLLAALNHPHIASVHGLQELKGAQCLIMELVDGETLAHRLTQGPIPVAEALEIAWQVATALHAAHEKNIVHRDLKPSNIAFNAGGQVKVLDFGLAKQDAEIDESQNLSHSPTLTNGTRAGVILGTAAYMSPEQAKGRVVDKRTDVWAFGCVIYETLTGKKTFDGDDVSDTLATVLKSEPDWTALPSDVPKPIVTLLHRCLDKDRNKRMADISTALFVLDELANLAVPEKAAVTFTPPPRRVRFIVPVVTALIAAALTTGIAWLWTRPVAPLVSRLTITPAPNAAVRASGFQRDFAITPDGRTVVYTSADLTQLLVRPMDQLDPTPLKGLGNPVSPFLSPDSQWIGFFDSNISLQKVAVTGGPRTLLCQIDGSYGMGATWGSEKTIVFATATPSTGLLKISADGGAVTVLTRPNRTAGETDHVWPEFLPGGRSVLFTITSTSGEINNAQIAVMDLTTGTQKVLIRGGSHGHYLPSGHLVYGRSGTIMAVGFDLQTLSVVGTPVPALSPVLTTAAGAANFDVSRDGTLAYIPGGVTATARTLLWVDRQGNEEALTAPARSYLYPRISPDGSRIALDVRDQDNDIWMWDVVRKTLTRFTSDLAVDRFPVWTPDGKRLIFNSDRDGGVNLYWQGTEDTAPAERLIQSPSAQYPTAVTPDGTRVIFAEAAGTEPRDLLMLTLDQARRAEPLVKTSTNDQNGQVSPDGRWLAYDADETGRFEIYVRPFPDVNAGHSQVSNAGGIGPLWSRNGQELFYWSPTGTMMAVRVGSGPNWSAASPVKLFEGAQYIRGNNNAAPTYDVSKDGRFIVIKTAGESQNPSPTSLIIVQNWFEELRRLAPR